MKVAEFYEGNNKTLPPELAAILNTEQSIWTNDAAYGYFIIALTAAGYSREQINKLRPYLRTALEDYTVEEAEKKWINW